MKNLLNKPLVSVCIPTYNAEKTIAHTIRSLMKQTYRNMEILVVDNASTDNTTALIEEYGDPRIRIYKNSKNIGAEANFSRCIQLADGDYIAIFHADDVYAPDIVQKQVNIFQDYPSCGAVFTLAHIIDDQGKIIGGTKLPGKLVPKTIYNFREIFFSLLGNSNFLTCPSAMVRGSLYKELASFNGALFGTSADLDMWLRILERQSIAILNEKLIYYRITNVHGSFQFNYLRTRQADFFKVMDHYLSIKADTMDIPQHLVYEYEFMKSYDRIICAINCIIQDRPKDAGKLLRESFSLDILKGAMGCYKKYNAVGYWILGAILLTLINFGVEGYFKKSLYWLRYQRG